MKLLLVGFKRFMHNSRSPCGERGLKSNTSTLGERWHFVAPRAGSVG